MRSVTVLTTSMTTSFRDRPNAERDGVSRDRADVERPDALRQTEDDAKRQIEVVL